MATRNHAVHQENTGSSALAEYPPPISLASLVLSSVISLADRPLIAYKVFAPAPSTNISDHLNFIEFARRTLISLNAQSTVLDSLLPSVHIAKDVSLLYVFAFGSSDNISKSQLALSALDFDGLISIEFANFTSSSIYPCSVACSEQLFPCPACPGPSRQARSPVELIPRKPLHAPVHHFLEAVRERLIDDIAAASNSGRSAMRLKDGFLLGPTSATSEWGAGWDEPVRTRPLIFCHLQVQLAQMPARLTIQPILRPTCYLPLVSSLPLHSGTPITLLPHGVPAHYLSTYAGPTAALTTQFDEALAGFGVGNWKFTPSSTAGPSTKKDSPVYIIAWLSVQNKQGEDKGMPIIWPMRLCLVFHPNSPSPHARTPLPYTPELPAQLQASPPPPAPTIPASLFSLSAFSATPDASARPSTPPPPQGGISRRPRVPAPSPSSDAIRAFRTLTLSTKPYVRDFRKVASEVSTYVDAVAKERERERERIKRERENGHAHARTASTSTNIEGAPPSVPPAAEPSEPTPVMAEPVAAPTPAIPPEPSAMEVTVEQEPEPEPASSGDESMDSLFSPPQSATDLPDSDDAMPPTDVPAEGPPPAPPEQALSAPPPEAERVEFDPYFDVGWPQSSNGFLDMNVDMNMNMDYEMGFGGMTSDSMGGARAGGAGGDEFDTNEGFGVFTDDDFSFFDAPGTTASGAVTAVPVNNAMDISMGFALRPAPLSLQPPLTGDGIPLSGPGPPPVMFSQASPWLVSSPVEGITPRAPDFHRRGDMGDTMPSPTKTPSSQSAPVTPAVQLSESDDWAARRHDLAVFGPSVFDPIPFAPSHRLADGKYVIGKFALPSPPDEEDRTEPMVFSSSPSWASGWKLKYTAATDPRIGIVRKLIGVKRKSFDQGNRTARASPAWIREHEEWENSSPTPDYDMDARSDAESEDEEPSVEEDDAMPASRPSTPPPSYLPMGPALLQTQFHHSRLLPLCVPLRPPDASLGIASVSTPPMSVPTPVSPAAVLGAASEKSKSLEAAVQLLVKEAVENSAWFEAWRINAAGSVSSMKPPTQVWQADVKKVARLIGGIPQAQSPVSLERLAVPDCDAENGSSPLFYLLDPPMFVVGKSDSVIQVLPPALRFWEKLGLGPRSGRKDVVVYVFFEGGADERESEVGEWLDVVSSTYSTKNYGTHSAGNSDSCTRPGLVPVRLETVKKMLVNFATTLPPPALASSLVFYIVVPPAMISLSSQPLRNLFSAVKRTLKTHTDAQILFHFVPEPLINATLADPRTSHAGLEHFVDSVYDRVLQPVERMMSRRLFTHGTRTRAYFHAPAFALARSLLPSPWVLGDKSRMAHVTFTLEPRAVSLDVVDRHTLLHVGYRLTSCGRWLLAACVDAPGEEHDLGAWLLPGEAVETFVVNQVWTFVRGFANRSNVEWRIVVAKLGIMSWPELNAWVTHLDAAVSVGTERLPLHVTLLSIEHELPWAFLNFGPGVNLKHTTPPATSSGRSSTKTPSGAVFADISSATYALVPPTSPACVPLPSSTSPIDPLPGSTDAPLIPDSEDDEPSTHHYPCMLARRMSALIQAPAGTDYTAISMVHMFHLYTARSLKSSYPRASANPLTEPGIDASSGESLQEREDETMRDITRNFHELAVLARTRWKFGPSSALPVHLAALEIMKMTLSGAGADT